jgi:phage terminase large subunit-like protein
MKKILGEYAPDIHIPERPTKLNLHGSEWVFEVVTSESEAKRNRVNVFVNEADGIPEIVANLLGRASGRKFIDFNPVKKFWAADKINALGTNIHKSTWKDNPYLSENQLQWFADLKKNGEFAEDGSPEKYAYEVYYCGNYSLLSGKAYELSDFDIRDEMPDKFDYMISYSDPSLGVGADYFASLLFGLKNNQVWVIDCIFSQFAKTAGFIEQLKAWDSKYGKRIDHYAEKNGTSGVVTKAAKELYDGSIFEVSNSDKKEADIIVYSSTAKTFKFVRTGKMLEFIGQCVDFPNAEHDDAPDCLARGAKILLKNFDIV